MSEIIPAILPKSFQDLEEKIEIVAGIVPIVHIDITDGTLTSGSTWPHKGHDEIFQKISREEAGLPHWEELNFEVHLMVSSPERVVEDWIMAGVERVIFHLEAFESKEEVSRFIRDLRERLDAGSTYLGLEIGLAINLNTTLDKLMSHINEIDFVHLMSIGEIGEQGNPFDPRIYDRITQLKKSYPETIISIDGGVSVENLNDLLDRGADRLVVGSAIFRREDPRHALHDLLNMTKHD